MEENKITSEEIKMLLQFNKKEKYIYVPNEIFQDISSIDQFKNVNRRAFCYAYYYILLYLYRFAKYGINYMKTNEIKMILGYSNDKRIDSIIKHNGILDQIGYTYSSKDFPIEWKFKNDRDKWIEFSMFSEFDEEYKTIIRKSVKLGGNYKIKVPIKGLHRTKESFQEGIEDGVFFEVENTHRISAETMIDILSDKELGCIGFFVYGYLVSKEIDGRAVMSIDKGTVDLGIKKHGLIDILEILNQREIIKKERGIVKHYKEYGFISQPNTYCILK